MYSPLSSHPTMNAHRTCMRSVRLATDMKVRLQLWSRSPFLPPQQRVADGMYRDEPRGVSLFGNQGFRDQRVFGNPKRVLPNHYPPLAPICPVSNHPTVIDNLLEKMNLGQQCYTAGWGQQVPGKHADG